jgi:hypothetical protein
MQARHFPCRPALDVVSDNVLTGPGGPMQEACTLGKLRERYLVFAVLATVSVPVVCPGACVGNGGRVLAERGGEPR